MYVMFCYVVLCYVILYYVMLCIVMLSYFIFGNVCMYVCMYVFMFVCNIQYIFLRKTAITPDNLTLIKLSSTNENLPGPSILVNHHVLYPGVMFNILQPIHQHSVRVLKFDLHILLMIPIFRLFK